MVDRYYIVVKQAYIIYGTFVAQNSQLKKLKQLFVKTEIIALLS